MISIIVEDNPFYQPQPDIPIYMGHELTVHFSPTNVIAFVVSPMKGNEIQIGNTMFAPLDNASEALITVRSTGSVSEVTFFADHSNMVFTQGTPVPELSTWLLLIVGFAAVAAKRWRYAR